MTDETDRQANCGAASVGDEGATHSLPGTPAVSSGPEGSWRMHPLAQLTLTRIREFLREPEVVFWVFVFPVLLACALGIAFRSTKPERIRIAVEDSGQSAAMRQTLAALEKSPDVAFVVRGKEEAAKALRTGSVALVVRVAELQILDLKSPNSDIRSQTAFPQLVYRYDPTRPESRAARLAVDNAMAWAQGRLDSSNPQLESVVEPGARYIDFLVPGLIGLNLMGSGMWGVGFAIVGARGRKLLKRFAATPMRRSHYLLSFILSRLIFLFLEMAAIVGFARLVFGVIVRGSLIDVALCAVVGALGFSGMGLLVAARPRTIEGVSGLMNFVMLPMWLLSGTFFPASRFPPWFQPIIKALPLTALNDVMRAVMNEGAPLASHWPQLAIVLLWGLVGFVVALRIFRWQ